MVSDPNIALILIALGTLAIYVEFCRPGRVVPGVVGGVAFVVGLASLVNPAPNSKISWWLVVAVFIPVSAITVFLVRVAIRARRNKRTA